MTSPLADIVVVLGARVYPDGQLSPALARRVERGARAWREGVAPLVLCTGGKRWNGHGEAHRMREVLLRLGVDDRAIVLELFAMNTAENALYSARLMRMFGLRRAAIITCPWHMPRAVSDFARCGVDVEPMPTVPGPGGPVLRWWRRRSERVSSALDAAHLFARTTSR